jgi:histidinol-phosphate aminotransferase
MTPTELPLKPHIAKLPAYKPPVAPPGVRRLIDLSSNENPLGPSPKAVAAVRAALGTMNRYPDASSGMLKEAIAEKLGVRAANIAIGNGADEWVILLCLSLLDPGDEVVMAHGSFISYLLRTLEMGATPVRIPLRDFSHDLASMANAVTDRTKIIFVCNPNNPTGTAVDSGPFEAFLARVPGRVLVVVDEAYYEYAVNESYPRSVEMIRDGQENLVSLRSFSKVYGLAGLRVGYLIASETVVDYAERARPPFNVNRLAQVAAHAALGDDDHVRRSLRANVAAMGYFDEEMQRLGLSAIPSRTNFMAVGVGRPGAEISGPLLQRGFLTTAMDGWGVPDHLRFSFGLPDENEAFVAALAEVVGTGR